MLKNIFTESMCIFIQWEQIYSNIYKKSTSSKSFWTKVLTIKKPAVVNAYQTVGMRIPQLCFPLGVKIFYIYSIILYVIINK